MALNQNPETILIQDRPSISVNQKALAAELKSVYCRKAWRVGLTLDQYCSRFNIPMMWEVQHDAETV